MQLTLKFIKINIKKILQYKLNFIVLCIAVAPIQLIQLVISWIIARNFRGVMGWDILELMFLYSIILVSYSIAQIFFREFRYIDRRIISGGMDMYYLRPLPITYNLIFSNLSVMEIFSQLLPAVIICLVICLKVNIVWTMGKIIVLICGIVGGVVIQACIFLLIGLTSFWTIKSSQLEKAFFNFKSFLNYPLDIYGDSIKQFFTFVLPMGFANYYPARYILEKGVEKEAVINFMTVPVSLLILFFTAILWKKALNRYTSTGS